MESIISEIDINIKEEKEFITLLNGLGSIILFFFKDSLRGNENLVKSIKSFQNELFLLKSIPENASNKIILYNSELLNKINCNEFNLRQFFEKVKNLYKLMKEKKQLFSKLTNSNYQIKLDYNKLNHLSKENLYIKEYNEKLIKAIGAKTLIINQLEIDLENAKNSNLFGDSILSNQQEVDELKEEIKKLSLEKEQQRKLLEKKGIEIIGGEKFETLKEEIIERLQNEIEDLKKKINISKQIEDFIKENKALIEPIIEDENKNLKKKLSNSEEEINSLKLNYEKKVEENQYLKSKLEIYEKEKSSLREENEQLVKEIDGLNNKYKELEMHYPNNKIINSINNININNRIRLDDVINKIILFIQENEKLKKENEKLKNEKKMLLELNIKSIKRSYFENTSLELIQEEEYDKEKMSARAKISDNIQNLSVDYPDISNIIEKYKELEFNYKTLNSKINKSKDLLKTETNDKILRIELSKILGLVDNKE